MCLNKLYNIDLFLDMYLFVDNFNFIIIIWASKLPGLLLGFGIDNSHQCLSNMKYMNV